MADDRLETASPTHEAGREHFFIDNNKHLRKQKDRKDPQLITQVRKKYNKIEVAQNLGPYSMSNAPPKWAVMPQSRTSKEMLHTVTKKLLDNINSCRTR